MLSAQKYNSSVAGDTRKKDVARVLLIGTHVPPSVGSRSVAEDLAQRLGARGFELRLTSRRRSPILRVVDMLLTVWLSRGSYDVAQVDVYSGRAFRWAEWVARLLTAIGKPFVLTLRGGNLPEFALAQPSRVIRLLASATVVTAPSRYLAEALRDKCDDIQVIPNSLGLESYTYTLRERPKARLIWLRTFHRIYDPILAVRVLARVSTHVEDAHLTMIGPDKDGTLSAVRAEAERLGVLPRILFTGGVGKRDVPGWLASGDIFLNTTTIDNTPVSLLEAMAIGLPIVSTDVGGIPYLLESGSDAILVPPGDVEAMTDAVLRLLSEPDLARRISRNARAKAETFGWEFVLPRWEALFLGAARQSNPRNARLAS
jgi:glycosyltransferase involved in cell wall biosynthesis